jgi:hypothetical protein
VITIAAVGRVVEDQQQALVPEEVGQEVEEQSVAGLAHLECLSDRRQDQPWLVDRGQLYEGSTVRKAFCQRRGDVQRQSRLADPARSGQRDQTDPRRGQQVAHRRRLALAADQRRQRGGWLAGQRGSERDGQGRLPA